MKFALTDLALKRPITVIMLVITVIGLGIIAWNRIPLEFIHRMDFPTMHCRIPYPNSTPEQVESAIAIPAEGEFRTVSNLKRIWTTSDSNGCSVRLLFDAGTNMSLATSEVRDRMERLRLKLPSDVHNMFLFRFSSQSLPILVIGLAREGDDEELAHRIRTSLQPRLLRVSGVAEVQVQSKPEQEVLIEFDQEALRAHGIAMYDVVAQLQRSSLNVSVGEIHEGGRKYYVRALGEFHHPDELARLMINQQGLRVDDVARVGYQARELLQEFHVDGKGGAVLVIRKEAEANTVATCQRVHQALDEALQEPDFHGVDVFVVFDQGELIQSSLGSLLQAGRYGGLLALGVLFLFLRKIRATLVVALAIPTSIVVSLVFMFFAGMTLNLVTMCSLIIALGMLVDNAIVVLENIYRHRQLGHGPMESARRGAREVGVAITAATMTTIVVFASLLYMETGEMGQHMSQFAIPITVALLASLVIALTVIPLATSRMQELSHLKEHPVLHRLKASAEWLLGKWFIRLVRRAGRLHPLQRLISTYINTLHWTMRWRLATVLIIVAFAALTLAIPFRRVGMRGMPDIDTREVRIELTFEQNFDMDMARSVVDRLTASLNDQRAELGIEHVFVTYTPEGGQVSCFLYDVDAFPYGPQPPYSTEEVLDILWQRFSSPETGTRLPGAELGFSIAQTEGATRSVRVRMRGDDAATLAERAEQFKNLMARIPNVSEVQTDADRDREELQLRIDETLAKRFGLNPLVIARTVDFALRGSRMPYLKREGREIPVWAQFREEDRKRRSNLENVAMLTPTGELVPLHRIVEFNRAHSPRVIRRVDARNVISITANVSGSDLRQIKNHLEALAAGFPMPRGYSIELGDELLDLARDRANFITGILLAIIMIYLVMGALFESFILPLSILTTIPVSFLGVWWTMFLTRTPMDTVTYIGMFLMVGVIVNNGIVIVDHINQLRAQGNDRLHAILQAGRDRFRPVTMTALTTILGCVPLAVGRGLGGEIAFHSVGRALIGGLTMGTFLTLFIVPLFYTIIDDLRRWMLSYAAGLAALGAKPAAYAANPAQAE